MIRWQKKASEINLTYLENICGDDKVFIRKVVETYLTQIPEFLNNIESGLSTSDTKLLASSAHKIRSSSQFIGSFNIADLAHDLERHCLSDKAFSIVYIEEMASKILLMFQTMKPELQKILNT